MALIDDVKNVLNKLASHGWEELFEAHGLDISANDLKQECLKLLIVDRNFPGFEDYSIEGNQGIVPGSPARSLIYHALASPNVKWSDKGASNKLTKYPTLEQLEIVENFVFGIEPKSISFLESKFPIGKFPNRIFGIVVFASQYRSAIDTPHKKHADLVYSRTGVSRVGTAQMKYVGESRSFTPVFKGNSKKIRVLPARYSVYLSVRLQGSSELLGTRFNKGDQWFQGIPSDPNLSFWFPIHKLFEGDECLDGMNLKIELNSFHSNEKISRIHKFIASDFSIDPGSRPDEHTSFPYTYSNDIASLDSSKSLVVPTPSEQIVKKANDNNPITLNKNFTLRTETPGGDSLDSFSSSLEIRSGSPPFMPITGGGNPRKAPEYMHIRTQKLRTGRLVDLNSKSSMIDTINNDSYKAVHYIDFTGDGIVNVNITSDRPINLINVPAYSLVAAPDFFPFVEQSEILDSTASHSGIWNRDPLTLADTRILPNVQSHPDLIYQGMGVFDTCTALISGTLDDNLQPTSFKDRIERRVTYLPDGAAGVFAPGWDTSFDMISVQNMSVPHLASYGLGSPFPEDAKLCAALSSFWPAVAPDISRSFWPARVETILPLLDSEIGAHGAVNSWDGEKGPTKIQRGNREVIRYKRFEYVDYTLNASNGMFDYEILSGIDADEYMERILKFKAIKDSQRINRLLLTSYTQVNRMDKDVQTIEVRDGVIMLEKIHKFIFANPGRTLQVQGNLQMIDVEINNERTLIIDGKDSIFEL